VHQQIYQFSKPGAMKLVFQQQENADQNVLVEITEFSHWRLKRQQQATVHALVHA